MYVDMFSILSMNYGWNDMLSSQYDIETDSVLCGK